MTGRTITRNGLLARRLTSRLVAPVDVGSLVVFRLAFGVLMLSWVLKCFRTGEIQRYYIDPSFHFTYFGFSWVRPWPGDGVYVHFAVLGLLAVCVLVGFRYRITSALFGLGYTYVFLLDQARFVNHTYLLSLISLLMPLVPAHRAFSIDAHRWPRTGDETAPAWALWILRFQIGVAYFYGGLMKINGDWLRGEPMRSWLPRRGYYPIIGPVLEEEFAVQLFTYGGLYFDLLIVPLLLWRRTRMVAFAVAVLFNVTNAIVWGNIGVFSWFMLAGTQLFLSPDWPRRVQRWWTRAPAEPRLAPRTVTCPTSAERLLLALLGCYVLFQLLMPLRHHLYPGNHLWTEEGARFAWNMKLHDKNALVYFVTTDPVAGRSTYIDPACELAGHQARVMSYYPDMILQYAHHIAGKCREAGGGQLEVRAVTVASMNGRPYQRLVDPEVDLARQARSLAPASWIVPLEVKYPPKRQASCFPLGSIAN